jgi:hypothetical protein
MDAAILQAVCRMPVTYRARGDVSWIAVFDETGFVANKTSWSSADVEAYLRKHPELVDVWLLYSDDQRCSPAWYVVPPKGNMPADSWRVGHQPRLLLGDRRFKDAAAAVTFFIEQQVRRLSGAV